jgi:hypothetical protein
MINMAVCGINSLYYGGNANHGSMYLMCLQISREQGGPSRLGYLRERTGCLTESGVSYREQGVKQRTGCLTENWVSYRKHGVKQRTGCLTENRVSYREQGVLQGKYTQNKYDDTNNKRIIRKR